MTGVHHHMHSVYDVMRDVMPHATCVMMLKVVCDDATSMRAAGRLYRMTGTRNLLLRQLQVIFACVAIARNVESEKHTQLVQVSSCVVLCDCVCGCVGGGWGFGQRCTSTIRFRSLLSTPAPESDYVATDGEPISSRALLGIIYLGYIYILQWSHWQPRALLPASCHSR